MNLLIITSILLFLILSIILVIYLLNKQKYKSLSNTKYRVLHRNNNYNLQVTTKPEVVLKNPLDSKCKIKIWNTTNTFPELCASNLYGNKVPDINKVSLAISGGGPRSFSVNIGYFRALTRMGHKNKAQYVSTVSGGSWFNCLYSFYQNIGDVDKFLGKSTGVNSRTGIPDPALITLANLKRDNADLKEKFIGYPFCSSPLKNTSEFVTGIIPKARIPTNKAYNEFVKQILLFKNLKIDGNLPMALNKAHADDIYSRNPSLGRPLYLKDNLPFWLCNSSLLFKYETQYPLIPIASNLLYTGITGEFVKNSNKIGGIVTESFAFGATTIPDIIPEPTDNCEPVTASCSLIDQNYLYDIVGTSSFAAASGFYEPKFFGTYGYLLPDSIDAFLDSYKIWGTSSLYMTSKDSQCHSNLISGCYADDGYNANSCTRVGTQCYSNTANQCTRAEGCSLGINDYYKPDCKNNNSNNSSLNCNFSFFGGGCNCEQKYPPYMDSSDKKSYYLQNAFLGDGVISDNLGVVSLLARGVKKIISFANFDLKDPGCEISFKPLFGKLSGPKADCEKYLIDTDKNSQVFKTEDYNKFYNELVISSKEGGPAYSRLNLEVLPNNKVGVKGGYIVDILFIVMTPPENEPTQFLNRLSADVRKEIGTDSSLMFQNFPYFATAIQNGINLLYYTLPQINILSTYADWYLSQEPLASIINDMYKD